ncbi:hypothetical protein L1049_024075 [Liquidambar formosana]|uniref:BZIP domain-containing protein n=1 Tax=Liquidambar formosana TaxID=63359 RepID=A0AAP0RVJ4_LIQFO
MAQLPPKIPNMTPNWPDFSHQRIHSMGSLAPITTTTTTHPLWVDEFLDFSSTKRGTHRRSASDSIAFLEAPMADECRNSNAHGDGVNNEFDRFDDEQFLSMFTDEMTTAVAPTMSSSNPSTPSDHNSINDEKQIPNDQQQQQQQVPKNESEEVQSSCKLDSQATLNATVNTSNDRTIDPKRVKRILANRQSAQRSRVRKLQYISELERSVTSLQTEVSALSPRVAFLDHQRLLLNVDNSALKQRIAALAQDKIFKDAHQEALKREIERLRQVYHQQNLKKMGNATPPPSSDAKGCTDKEEQLLNT